MASLDVTSSRPATSIARCTIALDQRVSSPGSTKAITRSLSSPGRVTTRVPRYSSTLPPCSMANPSRRATSKAPARDHEARGLIGSGYEAPDDPVDVLLDIDAGLVEELLLAIRVRHHIGHDATEPLAKVRPHHVAHIRIREHADVGWHIPQLSRSLPATSPGPRTRPEGTRAHRPPHPQRGCHLLRGARIGSEPSFPPHTRIILTALQKGSLYCSSTYSRRSTTRVAAASEAAKMTANQNRLPTSEGAAWNVCNIERTRLIVPSCGMACGTKPCR